MVAIGIIFLVIFGIGGLIGYLLWHFTRREHKFNTWGVAGPIIAFFIGLYLLTGVSTVPAGHRGVVLMWGGQVEQRIATEGLNFIIPMVESVSQVDVRVQAHAFKDIDAASKEMQSVRMTGNVNWRFEPMRVNTIYQTIGASKDFVDKILDKALQDFLKEVTPTYSIVEILPKRSEIRAKAVEAISSNLARYFIIIEDIYIADIQFSPEYLAAIEKQQVAERQVTTEKNILEQKKIQAEQVKIAAEGQAQAAIAQANGEKQSIIVRAQGQAQSITTVADAQAKANETVNKTLTNQIIQYSLVQKLSEDIKVIVLPSGQQFILGPEVLGK